MTSTKAPVVVPGESGPELRAVARVLAEHEGAAAQLVLEDGATVALPSVVIQALQQIAASLANGDIAIDQFDGYTPSEAASFLGASRSYVATALASGELPYRLVDAEVRIAHADLLRHRARLDELHREGVRLIQQIGEESGAYDER